MIRYIPLLAVFAAVLLAAAPARGQAEALTTPQLLEAPADSVALQLAPMRLDALEQLIPPAMEELERSAFGLAEMLRVKLESRDESGAPLPQPELEEQITSARTQHTSLISRVKLLLDAAEAKGADVASQRQYVQAVSGLGRDAVSAPPPTL